jgi:hypothetical protein
MTIENFYCKKIFYDHDLSPFFKPRDSVICFLSILFAVAVSDPFNFLAHLSMEDIPHTAGEV